MTSGTRPRGPGSSGSRTTWPGITCVRSGASTTCSAVFRRSARHPIRSRSKRSTLPASRRSCARRSRSFGRSSSAPSFWSPLESSPTKRPPTSSPSRSGSSARGSIGPGRRFGNCSPLCGKHLMEATQRSPRARTASLQRTPSPMDEFERIREALGAPEADDAGKARAWARLQREIASEQPSPTRATPTPPFERDRRPPPRRRYAVLLGIAAAIQPIGPGTGFLYTDVESEGIGSGEDVTSGLSWDLLVRERLQTWVSADGTGRQVTTVDRVGFASPGDRTRWVRAGRPPLPTSTVERYGPGGLPIYDVASLPSDPKELRGAIHAGHVIEEPYGPLGIFTGIGDLLAQPNTPPDVRRGLLELAAETPGITLEPGITDPLGRPGEGFMFRIEPSTETLIIDPGTAHVLATIRVDPQGRTSWSAYVRDAAVPTAISTP